MKKWITLTEVNSNNLTMEIDADSIISYGPNPGATNSTQIRTSAGHTLVVKELPNIVATRIKGAE